VGHLIFAINLKLKINFDPGLTEEYNILTSILNLKKKVMNLLLKIIKLEK
jgi:hypothetical protein